jgi:hypothetical protein
MPPDTTWTILTTDQWNGMQSQFVIYQYSAVLMVFVILGLIILFKDTWPFIWARFISHEVVVGILDPRTRRITPNKDFKKLNGLFYHRGQPLPFVKVYPGNFMFTGLPFDILDINIRKVDSPLYQRACANMVKAGYKNIDALEKAIIFSQMNRGDHRIAELMVRENYKTYEEAKKAINPKNYTIEGPDVKQFFTSTQMSDLNGYGTEVPSDDILNEVDDVYEARKPSMLVKREIMKIIPVCLLMFALAAAGVVLYMVFLKPH